MADTATLIERVWKDRDEERHHDTAGSDQHNESSNDQYVEHRRAVDEPPGKNAGAGDKHSGEIGGDGDN